MATEIRLPQLGQTMEEGTIVDCSVKVGDQVSKGDVIFEIETDKATLEMESPFRLLALLPAGSIFTLSKITASRFN